MDRQGVDEAYGGRDWAAEAPPPPPARTGGGPAFEVRNPERLTSPLVFASPHSGRIYPPEMVALSALGPAAIRKSEDAYVDALFASAPAVGAPLILARYARAFVDVNREPYEFDPALFIEPLPAWVRPSSARATAGLGSVARVVGEGVEIYRGKLAVSDAVRRIETVHRPYHAALEGLLETAERRFGCSILIDCHSMPSAATASSAARPPPDVVLGDRFGAACNPCVTAKAEAILQSLGLVTARNTPYAGGWTTEHYGRPRVGRHALQVELARSLYLDERTLRPAAGLSKLTAQMQAFCERMAAENWGAMAA